MMTAGVCALSATFEFWKIVIGASSSSPRRVRQVVIEFSLAYVGLILLVVLPTAVLFLMWLYRAR